MNDKLVSALLCLANGSEEIESITPIVLLRRANIKVNIINLNSDDNNVFVTCARGIKICTDMFLNNLEKNNFFDVIILPGGSDGAKCFQKNKLLIDYIYNAHLNKKLIAAICASPALVLHHHNLFPYAKMTCYPELKSYIPSEQWINESVVYDKRYHLITSQGPGTAIDFSLKIIEVLLNKKESIKISKKLIYK